MKLVLPAEPASVPELRHRVTSFAKEHGLRSELVADVALAVSEAVTNAVKYAQTAGSKSVVEVRAAREDEWLEVMVRDRGEAFGRGSVDGLGLGLSIMARLAGDLRIVQEGDGTEVRMRFPLAA
jgi:serine/threonine-protein kinase RsbW